MRILIGYSVCPHTYQVFKEQGHDVWTCDLLPASNPEQNHLRMDVWAAIRDHGPWDFGIFHPMCTYLTVSAAWAFKDPDYERWPEVGYHQKISITTLTGKARRDAREKELATFRRLLKLPFPCVVENPARSFINKAIRPPDQIVHPYMLGDDASKATGLWYSDKNTPKLPVPPEDAWVAPRYCNGLPRWANQTDSGQNRETPSSDRWLKRSATYPGIAKAFGIWGLPTE